MGYDYVNDSVAQIVASAISRLTGGSGGGGSGGGGLASFSPATLSQAQTIASALAFVDTGVPAHTIGGTFKRASFTAHFYFQMTDAKNGWYFKIHNDERWGLFKLVDGVEVPVGGKYQYEVFEPQLVPAGGTSSLYLRRNPDGSAGLFQNGVQVTRPTYTGLLASHAAGGTGVALKVFGQPMPNVIYGGLTPALYVETNELNVFARSMAFTARYANTGGVVPDYAEIQFKDTGPWLPIRTVSNEQPGLVSLSLDALPKSVEGFVDAKMRWHNTPAAVQQLRFEAVSPFGRYLGGNGGGQQIRVALIERWGYLKANGKDVRGLGDYIEPGNYPVSADGLNGTIMRSADGGIGRNSLGIAHYVYREEARGNAANAGTYEVFFPAGVQVQQDIPGYPREWTYDSVTGRGTFVLLATDFTVLQLRVIAASIPAGTTMKPGQVRKVGTPAGQVYKPEAIDLYKKSVDGLRWLDASAYNNFNTNTRTYTALPVSTFASRGAYYQQEINDTIAIGATFCFGQQTHLDHPDYVRRKAKDFAEQLPASVVTFLGTSNEPMWNPIFTQDFDLRLAGVRAGLDTLASPSSPRTPVEIIDGSGYGLPAGGYRSDAAGNPAGGEYICINIPLNAGQQVMVRNNGGVMVWRAKVATPAGVVFHQYNAEQGTDPKFERSKSNDDTSRAGIRYYSEMVRRNGDIWREEYAKVGRAPPRMYCDGTAAYTTFSLDVINWNNLYEHVEGVSLAPYFNNGLGGFDFTDFSNASFWDAPAKALIAAQDYTGAARYVGARAIVELSRIRTFLRSYKYAIGDYDVSKGRPRGTLGLLFYEMGDHSLYSIATGWPGSYQNGQSQEAVKFMNAFWADPVAYDFFKAYLLVLAESGAPAFVFNLNWGNRPFSMYRNEADSALSGPSQNHYYRAMHEVIEMVRATVNG